VGNHSPEIAPPAQALSSQAEVICLQVLQTGTEFASCSQQRAVDDNLGNEVRGTGEAAVDLDTGVLRSRSVAQAFTSGTTILNAGGGSARLRLRHDQIFGGGSSDHVVVSEVDFGNSAHLSLILPQGVPWTSGSGVFLTSSVPEPGTGALVAVGVLCLTISRRVPRRVARCGVSAHGSA
jgi:PEP-CTERM motif